MRLFIADTDAEIASCFPVFQALRPHLPVDIFLAQVRRQQAQSYRILALETDQGVFSAAGFRHAEFLAWGKILYIDDLSTLPGHTRRGYASALLQHLQQEARATGCSGLHLDSGHARHTAHRLYMNQGMHIPGHHFAISFAETS